VVDIRESLLRDKRHRWELHIESIDKEHANGKRSQVCTDCLCMNDVYNSRKRRNRDVHAAVRILRVLLTAHECNERSSYASPERSASKMNQLQISP